VVTVTCDAEEAGPWVEPNRPRDLASLCKHEGGGQRGMAAEVVFDPDAGHWLRYT